MPLPSLPLRVISILGSYTGNLAELKELIQLVKGGKVQPISVATRPLAEVGGTWMTCEMARSSVAWY